MLTEGFGLRKDNICEKPRNECCPKSVFKKVGMMGSRGLFFLLETICALQLSGPRALRTACCGVNNQAAFEFLNK